MDEFNKDLTFFQRKRQTDDILNVMSEKNIFNKLIVMDDVSGLADRSNESGNFLTVAQKFNFTCRYVFHTIYLSRPNWQMIISQTNIFNIFPGSLQIIPVAKILFSYCNRYTYEYIPHRDLWTNRLYFEISNYNEKKCLTIDTYDVSNLGPSKFRTGAKNGHQQICYFYRNKKDEIFNRFLAVRKETSADKITFSIVNLIDESNNLENR